MTRKDSACAGNGSARAAKAAEAAKAAKGTARHAAEAMAPHVESARDTAARYAQEAGARLGPKVSHAAHNARHTAREGYDQYVVPRVSQAREALPAEVDRAAARAAKRTRRAAREAARYAGPRLEHAMSDVRAAAGPAREEATARGAAAVAALRGEVTVEEIEKVTRRRRRRARTGTFLRRAAVVGLVAGGAYAAWRWWDRQTNPDWLVEPPAATEVSDRGSLTTVPTVNGSHSETGGEAPLDPEVQAKQADAEADERRDQ
ncbi:DUF5324 family protein [Streptomyces iconiensis]|uniref:DUF5324 family protein n=1 Tax=Streptomyces iconiensis TaxID=1384038 RepID=A0ABT6ZRD6_9ACTN|nr:DUF5324 family protein [Streptomyces iconiensis]MDJ1131629.1 DUF5324 family protein [Streptomyces iconiensis]